MPSFAERIAHHRGRPVTPACSVRPPATTWTIALGAGAGALFGSIVGVGAIMAGVGVIVAFPVLALLVRRNGQSVGMALVLEEDRVELLRMSWLGNKPTGVLRSIPYGDIRDVRTRDRILFEVVVTILTVDDTLQLAGSRRGVGAAPQVIGELRLKTEPGTAAR